MIEKSSLRNRLLKERLQLPSADRELAEKTISVDLKQILASQKGPLGFYWPVRGEFDPRQVVKEWVSANTTNTACLPVIVKKNNPMIFREWIPGQPMIKGTFNINVPHPKNRILVPNILLVPTLGFNQKNFSTALINKLNGIATGATNVTNNNQLTNGAGFVTSSIINSLNASNLSSGTVPAARIGTVDGGTF